MPRRATGSELQWTKVGYPTIRVTLPKRRETIKLKPYRKTHEAAAIERGKTVAELAERLTRAQIDHALALDALQRVGAAPITMTAKEAHLWAEHQWAEKLIDGHRLESKVPTLNEIEALWFSGALARKHRGIKQRKPATAKRQHLAYLRRVAKIAGSYPVDMITLELADKIKDSLPEDMLPGPQRQELQPFKYLLQLCVYPLKLIKQNPLPKGWMPSERAPRTLQWLWPDEDYQLMQCTAVPLWARVFFGWLIRYGSREGEAIATRIEQIELDRGVAKLFADQTKTKKERAWTLTEGDVRGLRAWLALARAGAAPTDRMFVNEKGKVIRAKSLYKQLRRYARQAGINRPELYVTNKTTRGLAPHDLRASHVTTKLALGWTERQVMQCTGHETSTQLAEYARTVALFRSTFERSPDVRKDFAPLDEAIPELAAFIAATTKSQRKASDCETVNDYAVLGNSIVESVLDSQVPDMTKKSMIPQQADPSRPVQPGPAGDSVAFQAAVRIAALELNVASLERIIATALAGQGQSVERAITAELALLSRSKPAQG